MRILATLSLPDAGSATIGGFDVVSDAVAVRSIIGLAGQFAAVDEVLTGRENLEIVGRLYRLPKTLARERAAETLERLGLTDAADRAVRTYSGGMRRRLDLGASLVGRPTVLLLDEPTTGLDPSTRVDLWDFLRDLVKQGTTVLLTTQYLDEADQLADTITVIDRGMVVAAGTADELKHRLGSDVLEFTVGAESELDKAREVLEKFASGDSRVEVHGKQLSISVEDGAKKLLEAIRAFDADGLGLVDVALRRPSLDDVFLSLTGHRATEEESQ